jgi:protein gp37
MAASTIKWAEKTWTPVTGLRIPDLYRIAILTAET